MHTARARIGRSPICAALDQRIATLLFLDEKPTPHAFPPPQKFIEFMENPAELEKMVPPNLRKWCRAEIWVDKEAIKRNVFWEDFNVDLRETGRGVPYLSEADGLTSGAWRRMYKQMPQDLLDAWAELLPESVENISTKNVRLRCAHPRPRLHGEEKRGFGSPETPPPF